MRPAPRRPPGSALFPYTTLFRSGEAVRAFGVGREYGGLRDVAARSAFLLDGERVVRLAKRYENDEVPDMDELVRAARGLVA